MQKYGGSRKGVSYRCKKMYDICNSFTRCKLRRVFCYLAALRYSVGVME